MVKATTWMMPVTMSGLPPAWSTAGICLTILLSREDSITFFRSGHQWQHVDCRKLFHRSQINWRPLPFSHFFLTYALGAFPKILMAANQANLFISNKVSKRYTLKPCVFPAKRNLLLHSIYTGQDASSLTTC